jgi:hypothetical protein
MCLYLYDSVILGYGYEQDTARESGNNFEFYFLRIHLRHGFPNCPFRHVFGLASFS